MAENKGILLAKSVQKHAGRAKEKLLQNLGKVDRTADEIFDEHLTNFNRQHTCATRLQKEFSNYIRCVRAVQSASKTLMDAIAEVYESQWTGSEALYGQTKAIDTQYQQFSYKLADQVLKQLDTYALQFPEMKKKIDKRGRKLVDYDSQRHSFQSLQANAAKRKDDVKVTRGREQLDEAKSTYEMMNSELHDELPALFDSRILFLVTNLQTLFACEQQFHSETSKVYADLEAIVDKLATESQRGSYTLKKINANSNPSSPQQSPVKANLSIVNNVTNGSANANGHTSQNMQATPRTPPQQQRATTEEEREPSYQNTEMVKAAAAAAAVSTPAVVTTNGTTVNGKGEMSGEEEGTSPAVVMNGAPAAAEKKMENGQFGVAASPVPAAGATAAVTELTNGTVYPPHQQPRTNHPAQTDASRSSNSNGSEKRQPRGIPETGVSGSAPTADADDTPLTTADAAAVAANAASAAAAAAAAAADPSTTTPPTAGAAVSQTSATTTDLPAGVLYRVKATYKYVREDVDELSFEVGDIINVVEYEDPEDQEEGWLMGLKEGTTERGMFPANFTRPL
uniref:Endophilin-A n=1 Tax=Anopheles atroparvus TaxID=41427 RepID=A0AAG5D622_ANOAO